MTGLDEEFDIGVHEWCSHSDVRSIRHDGILVGPLDLDTGVSTLQAISFDSQGKDVIPSTTVETRRMFLELVENLLHLESSRKGFNQNGRSDGTLRKTEFASSEAKHVVP